jgi:4-diphosphocytidyl-2-C-methyl-D-erythritol kinase
MRTVRIPAFAKVNLWLQIVARRPDGYHELRTVFQSIALHDTLELSLARRPGIVFECDDASLGGRGNLVWRALDALRRELNIRQGITARLEKQIPVARGLGGGSSDAAAALIGLLRLTKRALPLPRLVAIAASLGADVPYFLFGGRALGVNRGDEIYPLPDAPKQWAVVVSPHAIAVSTRDAFGWARPQLTKRAAARKLWCFCALCWSPQGAGLSNDFEAPVFRRHPRLRNIKRVLLQRGAAEAALAGSGSAVFGLFPNPAQARRAAQGFSGDQVFVVETLSRAEYRRAMGRRDFA